MPDIAQMFPSKYLQADDLQKGQNLIVTIDKVYPAAAVQRSGGDEPEIKWMVRFREVRKPMGLWKTTAKAIAEVLGTTQTEAWIGQQIAIYPSTYTSFGEIKPCINVDKWRPSQVQPPTTAITTTTDKRPIPGPAMLKFISAIKAQGKAWDDFLRWAKVHQPEAMMAAFGVALDDVPMSVVPAMQAYAKSLVSPQLQPREAVDTSTGEVITPAQAKVEGVAASDDIPF